MMIDLETPRFTQNETLRLLPELKAKQLQNWNQRGTVASADQKPGKTGKRLYTPLGIIMLAFMQQVNQYGVPPSDAYEMAQQVATVAFEFVESNPKIINRDDGSRWLPIGHEEVKTMRRGLVSLNEGHFYILMEGDGVWNVDRYNDRIAHIVGIAVEVEILIADCINRICLLEAGKL